MSGRLRLCKKWERQIQKGLVRALFVLRFAVCSKAKRNSGHHGLIGNMLQKE